MKKGNAFLLFFIFFLTAWLFPVLSVRFFPTVDGPAHLYNSLLIKEYLAGHLDLFFVMNSEPLPNWSGYVLMGVAEYLLPVHLVEKFILLVICLGIPFGMILLIRKFNPEPGIQWVLVLPFVYSLILYLGFINFLLSVVLLLVAIYLMLKWNNQLDRGRMIMLTILCTLVYFSHILSFVLLGIFTGILVLFNQREKYAENFFSVLSRYILIFVPGIIMGALFFSKRSLEGYKEEGDQRIAFPELMDWIKDGRPLISLNYENELAAAQIITWTIFLLTCIILVQRYISGSGFSKNYVLLVFSVVILFLYFIIPDGIASGGFVSVRLLYFFMMFLVIWILSNRFKQWMKIISIAAVSFYAVKNFPVRTTSAQELNKDVMELEMAAGFLEKGKTVLPLNYSNHWLHTNISNYLGCFSRAIVLDNYEAVYEVFPLSWKKSATPVGRTGNFAQSYRPYIEVEKYESETGIRIDYLTRWYYDESITDSVTQRTNADIHRLFTKIYSSPSNRIEVWARKE